MPFVPGTEPPKNTTSDPFVFLFRKEQLFVKDETGVVTVPRESDLRMLDLRMEEKTYLGMLDDIGCYCGVYEGPGSISSRDETFFFSALRPLLGSLSDELFTTAGIGSQIVRWQHTHRFCGRCGAGTVPSKNERALVCGSCGLTFYPRISPAIIVAVQRDEEILLARAPRFPAGLYSVLAGFVEPGESLEECLVREVREEVGISVTDVEYFGSQPWPFPHSLMIGFTARYAGGEIVPDPAEIADAGWFEKDRLPAIPPRGTISRRLIDWFVSSRKKKGNR